jgi:hypothetical protein
MKKQQFIPERGQFFWYIKEKVINKFPDLVIKSAKFDPKLAEHCKFINKGNCYLTEADAFESLID